MVRALPGTDVTLVCSIPKRHITYIIQTQWSKTDDTQLTRIAVYHPVYGTHYFTFPEASYNFSVSFSTRKCCNSDVTETLCSPNPNAETECNRWALHLKNVTTSLSGWYECSFATFPDGTKSAKIQLIVKAEGKRLWMRCCFFVTGEGGGGGNIRTDEHSLVGEGDLFGVCNGATKCCCLHSFLFTRHSLTVVIQLVIRKPFFFFPEEYEVR